LSGARQSFARDGRADIFLSRIFLLAKFLTEKWKLAALFVNYAAYAKT
jgi:hypothetical protein